MSIHILINTVSIVDNNDVDDCYGLSRRKSSTITDEDLVLAQKHPKSCTQEHLADQVSSDSVAKRASQAKLAPETSGGC